MAGLGKGFSTSFTNAANNRAAKEQDAFRIAYDQYTKKQEEYKSEESAWTKSLTAAETIVDKYGAPKEYALQVAKMLRSGLSVEYVDEQVKAARFASTPEVTAASDVNATSPVDTQMQDSGLQPAAPPEDAGVINNAVTDTAQVQATTAEQPVVETPSAAPQQNTDLLGALIGPNGIFKNAGESDEAGAQRRVREAGGISQEEFDKYNGGFKPPEDTSGLKVTYDTGTNTLGHPLEEFGMKDGVTKAKFIAADTEAKSLANSSRPEDKAKVARWEAIKPDLEVALDDKLDPQTKADLLKPLGESAKQRMEYSLSKAAAKTMAEQGMALAKMAEETDGKVLTATSGAVSLFESIKTEGAAVLDLIGSWGADQTANEESVIANAAAEIDKLVGGGQMTKEVAQQYREFTAASIRYIFAVGKSSLGQAGNGFSNKDYENVKNAILASNNKDAFINNLKRLSQEKFAEVDNQALALSDTAEIALLLDDETVGPALRKQMAPLETSLVGTPVLEWVNSPMTTATDPLADEAWKPGSLAVDENGNTIVFKGGDPYNANNWLPYNGKAR